MTPADGRDGCFLGWPADIAWEFGLKCCAIICRCRKALLDDLSEYGFHNEKAIRVETSLSSMNVYELTRTT